MFEIQRPAEPPGAGAIASRHLVASALAAALRDPGTARARCAPPPPPGKFSSAWRRLAEGFAAGAAVAPEAGELDPAGVATEPLESWLGAPPASRSEARRRVIAAGGPSPEYPAGTPRFGDADEFYRAFGLWNGERHPDDIPRMLAFVEHLLHRLQLLERVELRTLEDDAHDRICREALSAFLHEHVGPRVPEFGRRIEARAARAAAQEADPAVAARLRELAAIGRLLRAWVPMERALAAAAGASPAGAP